MLGVCLVKSYNGFVISKLNASASTVLHGKNNERLIVSKDVCHDNASTF